MDILVISDIHNDIENVLSYLDKLNELKFDIIICNGDWTDVNPQKGFTQEDIALIIIEEFKKLNKPILGVPGNVDTIGVLRILEEEGISIHGTGKIISGVGFYGFGGAKTPFKTTLEPDEDEIRLGLEQGWNDVKNAKFKVQVTHAPPKNTRIDITVSGVHVGSRTIRSFIEEKQPCVAMSSHICEARGTDNINNTQIINPGRFPEGYCGLVNIDINGKASCKVINIL